MKEEFDKCCICGKEGKLTFEHIPPRGANNDNRAKIIQGEELIKTVTEVGREPWNYDSLKYSNEQRGMGLYSLCSSCNNLTGTLYGNDYIIMVNSFIKLALNDWICKSDNGFKDVEIKEVYVSRFIKQVLSMFCSTTDGLSKTYPSIKYLILNKDAKLRNKPKYRISMFLLKNYRFGWTGANALTCADKVQLVSEIDVYPFGFIFEYDPDSECENLDITEFLKYSYDDKVNIKMRIPIRERNTIFPLDYRKKYEIRRN